MRGTNPRNLRLMEKNLNNIVRVPYKTQEDFFKYWMVFLKPYHFLTVSEMLVASAFLSERYELSQKISDPDLLDSVLFSEQVRKRIRESLGLTTMNFQSVLTRLRKAGVIVNGRINPRYIPNYNGEQSFKLLVMFDKSEDVGAGS